VTNIYPVAPAKPVAAIVLGGAEAAKLTGAHRLVEAKGAYSAKLLELGDGGKACAAEYEINTPKAGAYFVRAACDSGQVLRGFELTIDGQKAPRESVPYINMAQGITRRPYSDRNLSWIPGWRITLAEGPHRLLLKRGESKQASALVLDAIAVQPAKDMRLTE
jgi:hypothetical protein